MAKKTAKKTGIIKKKWYTILSPEVFNKAKIGEILLAEPEPAIGRKMSINLMSITGEPQKQNITVSLLLKNVSENTFSTELRGYRISPATLKKLIRRNREKIDDSFVVKTKDDKITRIKPITVTRGKTSNSVCTAIRKFTRAHIANLLIKTSFDDFVRDVMAKRIQQDLYKQLRKFYPISTFDIRAFNLLSEKEQKTAKILQAKKEIKPEKTEE